MAVNPDMKALAPFLRRDERKSMTDDEMSKMTLADLEVLARRFGAAVATIREAQALLGGRILTGGEMITFPDAHASPPSMPMLPQRAPSPPPPQLDPAELAERERLLKQFRDEKLPDHIRKLEEQ